MRPVKKLTLSAILVALGVVMLSIGAFFEAMDLTVCVVASLIVVFVFLEIGSPYTWLVWVSTALISFLFFPGSMVWISYLMMFGIYPLIKAYIEKLPRFLWLILKLVFANAVIVIMMFLSELIFSVPFFGEEGLVMRIVLFVLLNVAFVAYDLFITMLVRIYIAKWRPKFKKFLQ